MARSTLTTLVLISYNYARFLRDAVVSVLEQTLRPQILILDNASTDGSTELVEQLARLHPELSVRCLPTNIGLARIRNLAAGLVTTEWLVYLDSDDWLDRTYVERAEAWLATHRDVDVLTPDMVIVRDGARRRRVRSRVPRFWNDLLVRNTLVQSSFIRRSLVDRVGGYDAILTFEDWDFWIRVMQSGGRIGRLPAACVYRREHGRNASKLCDERAATAAVRDKHRAVLTLTS